MFENVDLLLDSNKDLCDLLPNPDRFDDVDPDLMLTSPRSDYCSPNQQCSHNQISEFLRKSSKTPQIFFKFLKLVKITTRPSHIVTKSVFFSFFAVFQFFNLVLCL